MEWTKEKAKEYREARGFGLVKMGKQLGVSHITIQNIENGKVTQKYAPRLTESFEAWRRQTGNYHNEDQANILKDLGLGHLIKSSENDRRQINIPLKAKRKLK